MTAPLPPVAPAANGAALPVSLSAPAPATATAPVTGTPAAAPSPAAAAQAPPVVTAPPAATAVRWSAEMLQNLRLQAFEQLVAQLARQVQASPNAPAPQWPASGVSEALGRMLQMLLEQMGAQQGRPLQMLAAQPGSAALLQALAAAAANPPTPAAAALPVPAASGPPGTPGTPAPGPVPLSAPVLPPPPAASVAPALASLAAGTAPVPPGAAATAAPAARAAASQALPPLQNWWVQQGTLVTPQGERGFMLSLQVPQAWAQAQLAATALSGTAAPMAQQAAVAQAALPGGPLAAALMAAPPAAGGQAPGAWRLPLDVPLQALASGPVAVVLQPRDEPQLRTSALLLLEFQPLRQAQALSSLPSLPFTALPPAMVQEMQQLLQNRGDPWLQMAVAQNAGAVPRERSGHQSHLCTTAGCQYEGRAPCAQPFCSEMNRLWGVARAERLR